MGRVAYKHIEHHIAVVEGTTTDNGCDSVRTQRALLVYDSGTPHDEPLISLCRQGEICVRTLRLISNGVPASGHPIQTHETLTARVIREVCAARDSYLPDLVAVECSVNSDAQHIMQHQFSRCGVSLCGLACQPDPANNPYTTGLNLDVLPAEIRSRVVRLQERLRQARQEGRHIYASILAHSDDETLAAGATLRVLARLEDALVVVIELAVDDPHREEEARKALGYLGVAEYFAFPFPDRYLAETRRLIQCALVTSCFDCKENAPLVDTVISHHPTEANLDHAVVGEIVTRMLPSTVNLAYVNVPYPTPPGSYHPNLLVRLQDTDVGAKLSAFDAFPTQLGKDFFVESLHKERHCAAGRIAGGMWADDFELHRLRLAPAKCGCHRFAVAHAHAPEVIMVKDAAKLILEPCDCGRSLAIAKRADSAAILETRSCEER